MKPILLFLMLSWVTTATAEVTKVENVDAVKTPGIEGATTPFLLKDGNHLWMSWQEPSPKSNSDKKKVWRVRVAKFTQGQWSSPSTVIESDHLMTNWADFPSLQKDSKNNLYLNWLETPSTPDTHGYFVNISKSTDQGKNWKNLGRLHSDKNPNAEHGFVTMVPQEQGVRIFWLDGGQMKTHSDAMQLRTAKVFQKIDAERIVDEKTCSCCGTTSIKTKTGPVVFYRDRSNKEIRDISMAYFNNKNWVSKDVSHDGWEIRGCPVNGPNADSDGKNIAMAWYCGGGNQPGVKVSFSGDPSSSDLSSSAPEKTFSKGIPVDDFLQGSLGRVQVLLANPDQAIVFWMKSKADGKADIYGRRVHRDGRRGLPVHVAETASTRGVGFPQVQKIKEQIFMVWTEGGDSEYKGQGLKMVHFGVNEIPGIGESDLPVAQMKSSGFSKGEYVPQFTAKDLNGKNTKLSKFKGKKILLNFWASWCDACIEEFGLINELEKKYAAKGLKIIMVNVDEKSSWSKADELIKKTKLSPTVWRNSAEKTTSLFGYSALPYTVLLDSELKIRSSFTGSLMSKKELLEKQLSYLLR